jgi:SAM-dependent methyltransferase
MDELQQVNRSRWNDLVRAGIAYTRPWLDLTPDIARARVDPYNMLGDVTGKTVLVLSGGGGQQSAALAMLGAQVTVLDLSDEQLNNDRAALDHYGLTATVLHGDMRDLSALPDDAFDLVLQPYSINFVPEVAPVFSGVRRVLRPGGLYQLTWGNPFNKSMDERNWNGTGYVLSAIYEDGELIFEDEVWEFDNVDGEQKRVIGPREFNHTLSTMLNALAGHDFHLLRLEEEGEPDAEANPTPGSWWHFMAVAPPYLTVWLRLEPAD